MLVGKVILALSKNTTINVSCIVSATVRDRVGIFTLVSGLAWAGGGGACVFLPSLPFFLT